MKSLLLNPCDYKFINIVVSKSDPSLIERNVNKIAELNATANPNMYRINALSK